MNSDIKTKIEARVVAESKKDSIPEAPKPELSDWEIARCALEGDAGDAAVFIMTNRGKFMYVKRLRFWMKNMGHYWQKDIDALETTAAVVAVVDHYRRVYSEFKKLLDDDEEPSRETIADHSSIIGDEFKRNRLGKSVVQKYMKGLSGKISKLRNVAGRKSVLEYVRSCPDNRMVIDGEELDTKPWLQACVNGVLHLKCDEFAFRDGRPEDKLTCAITTPWVSLSERCPIFQKFMMDILGGNRRLVKYMQRMLGHALIGKQREHVFLVLSGAKGRNGKDTLMNLLEHVLGLSVMVPVPAEMLLDQGYAKSSSGPAPDLMTLRGRRIAYASETDAGRSFSSSKVKWLSGGGRLVARGTYDLEMSYWDATHTLVLLTNDPPHARADDQAFWARLHLVPFKYSFLPNPNPDKPFEKQADPDILEKMKAEASGILAWLVRGCLKYQKTGLKPPQEVTDATLAYRDSEDLIGRFLRECCIIYTDEDKAKGDRIDEWKVTCAELFDAFSWWYARNVSQKRGFSNIKFGEILTGKGFEKRKSSTNYWMGIVVSETFKEERAETDKSLPAGRGQK